MVAGSLSSAWYMTGATNSLPDLRPRWWRRVTGAPSKLPPTLPSLARNSEMTWSFQPATALLLLLVVRHAVDAGLLALLRRDPRWGGRQRVVAAAGLGERDDVTDRVAAGQQRDDPVP